MAKYGTSTKQIKEAISILQVFNAAGMIKDSIDLAIAALEKQIPRQPHENYKRNSAKWCGCGNYLGYKNEEMRYCSYCGQRIDWDWKGDLRKF